MKQDNFEEKYKDIISLLESSIEKERSFNKPLLPHLLRVGNYLHKHGYSDDIVNAGLLHDIFEWTDHPRELIKKKFGNKVYNIVLANSKNREIKDSKERRKDYVNRCAEVGKDALIVKAADVLDSFVHIQKQEMPRSLKEVKI